MSRTASDTDAPIAFRRLAWVVLAATVAVIVSGDIVQATGSGAGCGESWPRCDGALVPSLEDAATGIEFAHRAATALLTGLIAALYLAARRSFAIGHPIRAAMRYVGIFFVVEVAIGALLVAFGWVEDDSSIGRLVADGLHVINTFLLIGALALVVHRARGGAGLMRSNRAAVVGASIILAIAITGAINSLADTLFPADTVLEGLREEFGPAAPILVRVRAIHPVIAVLGGVVVFLVARRLGDETTDATARQLARLVQWVVGAQFTIGILNLVLLTPVETQILHLVGADVLWLSFLFLVWSISDDTREAARSRPLLPEVAA